ncbi:MAG TPA: NAD(P)/FAD-dependent oxidoreductase [Myxococcus sp.]|nr:NAD(P)/FAD-dependent oxidoreductase [Myxococcus sp.]
MNTDVLIIGAGPAGSVAGSMLARQGHKVTCLEAGTFPRFQIGESLLPRCNDILEQAGLLDAVVQRRYIPKNAALFLKGEERERFCFAEVFPGQRTATFQVPRFDFDQTLATAARAHGADIQFNQRVDAVEFHDGGAVVTATDLESEQTRKLEAKFVVDCSGYGRVLPRLLKLEKPSSLAPRMAVFTWIEGDQRPTGTEEGDIWVCIHPRGAWIWIIPFSNGRTSVGVVMERALYDSVPGCDRDKLFTLLNEDPNARARLAKASPVLKTMKLEAWSASVEKLHGKNWALTGNAAEFLDPVFSSGVTVALESASRAANLIHRQLSGETVDWDKDYGQVVEKAVGVFRVFVRTWYTGELQRVLLRANKTQSIKRAITAILGGYVLDNENPFVRDPQGTLSALLKLG